MDINEQAFYTYFENIVYNTDEDKLTVDFLNDLAEKCSTELSIYDKEYPDNLKRNWVTITHLIDYPFYTFSYVTSADTALQIWEISLTDEQKAIDTYTAILRSGSYSYIDVLKDAGIESPFSEQRMQRLAKLMTKYLVDEEW